MSGKTAMRSGFFGEQLFLCLRDHLRSQLSRWVFGFDDGKLNAPGRHGSSGTGRLQHESQALGNQIFEGAALESRTSRGPAEEFIRKFNGRSHKNIFTY